MNKQGISGIIFLLAFGFNALSQEPGYKVATTRQYVHYTLDKIQKQFLSLDGKADNALTIGNNEEINLQLTYAAVNRLDDLQKQIELDTTIDNNQKVKYLRGLGEVLTAFSASRKDKKIKLIEFPDMLTAWQEAYLLDKKNESIKSLVGKYPSNIGSILMKGISFMSNPGLAGAREMVVLKYIEENPSTTLLTLSSNPDVSFADSLIVVSAKTEPDRLYSYAQAVNTKFGRRINNHPNEIVKLVCKLSKDNSGRLYFPFLDNLSKGKMTVEDIKNQMGDSLSYYRLLVKTQIDYASRMAKGDTPMVAKTLAEMIHTKAVNPFVNTINGLHDLPDAARFKKIEPLTPQELYYLIVSSESEIYTSSYVGTYNRIWQRMKTPSADSLLASVSNHHYKKFITMAANYNTLDNFLGRMSKEHATALMANFVNDLDKGTGEDDLEDAVDVANSYASINNPEIKKLMLNQITKNYQDAVDMNNERGQIVYRLEKLILGSSDSASNINLTDSLGILPVYDVKNNYLKDSLGRVVLQMYFYGDAGGRGSYETFKSMYTNNAWKRTDNPEWVQFTSLNTTTPFVIFANRPGDEEKNEDALAQEHLNDWMIKNNYQPAITVHRGHSYYLNSTVKQLAPSSKVIILGSCGAYHSLRDILKICPDAYLIASKQTGFGQINVPLFATMIDELKAGRDINWEVYWKQLKTKIAAERKGDFDDYIPPYKNLGAIFINAYKRAVNPPEEGT